MLDDAPAVGPAEETKLPSDVPWSLVGSVRLSPGLRWASGAVPAHLIATRLYPSLSVFYYPFPLAESGPTVPGHRIVLLKVAATLTGVLWIPYPLGVPIPGIIPCIGAIVGAKIACRRKGTDPWDKTGAYVRDIYPKHQEAVVNEITGQEVLQRASSSVSTTKSYNASGSFGLDLGFLSIGGGGGSSETTVTQSERERSQRNSRQTEVHNIYHVLTGYHLGRSEVQFSIQPRPFEGEHWELLNAFRILEGIQEFLIVLSVPYDAREISVDAGLSLGFRGEIYRYLWESPPPFQRPLDVGFERPLPPSPPYDQEQVMGIYGDPYAVRWGQKDDAWAKFTQAYQAWLEANALFDDWETDSVVVTTNIGFSTPALLYWGDDPCEDGVPNPCNPEEKGEAPDGDETDRQKTIESPDTGYVESIVSKPFRGLPVTSGLRAANSHMRELFAAVVASTLIPERDRVPLTKTRFYQSSLLRIARDHPEIDPKGHLFNKVKSALPKGARAKMESLGVQNLANAVSMITSRRPKDIDPSDFLRIQKAVVSGITELGRAQRVSKGKSASL